MNRNMKSQKKIIETHMLVITEIPTKHNTGNHNIQAKYL